MKQKLLLKSMLLLFALIAGSSSAWADETTVATFDSDMVVDNSAYADTYGGDDWTINMGGNNKSIGFNNKNCVTIGNALGTSATATHYGIVVKSKKKLDNVNKITFVYTGGSGDGGKLYLAYSTNGTTWSAISLNTGSGLSAQGVTPAQNTTFTFEFETIASAYYGFILDKGNETVAAYRFDYVTVNFINVPASSSAAATPTFSPATGTVLTKAQNVTVSSTGASKIIYTTNGVEPTIGGATTTTVNAASATVLVNGNMTIKAKGVDSSNEPSTMASATYTINLEEPVILPAERTYATTTNVSFTQADDIDVYYTIDGTTPTSSSTKYNGTPFAITENITVKAIAIDEYDNASDVVEAKFKNSDLQATEIEIADWSNLFGVAADAGSLSGDALKDYEGTIENVTVAYKKGSSSNMYIKSADLRIYNGNSLVFTAPAGYAISEIAFGGSSPSADKAPSANVGTFNRSTMKWTGFASSVTLSRNSGEGNTKFTSATITLSSTVPVTIASSGYSTIALGCGLDFANATPAGLEAYIVPSITASTVSLSAIDEAPASTGVILKGTAGATYTIPVKADAAAVGTNKLQAAVAATPIAANAAYILKSGKFHLVTAASTVPAGKAYLLASDISSPAPVLNFGFDGEGTTDIKAIDNGQLTIDNVYNLNGQRVAQPTKGLYIVNGKKVVIK